MTVRFVLIAAATMITASPISAEPPKAPAHPQTQPQSPPAQVVLASADEAGAPSAGTDQQSTPPVKRPRVARVTTCRCGDSQNPDDQ